MWKISKKIKVLLWIVLAVTALCGCRGSEELFLLEGTGESVGLWDAEMSDSQQTQVQSAEPAAIYVHVCGAVVSPGVVTVPAGSRAEAAVEAAGGFAAEADTAYVNLAAALVDGEQLYIPTKAEGQELKKRKSDEESGLTNLNTAGEEELCGLPGIGESKAGDIVAYRQQHGSFSKIEDIMQVPGIKSSVYGKIKDLITVD